LMLTKMKILRKLDLRAKEMMRDLNFVVTIVRLPGDKSQG
jgi:hypothetical protein